MNSSKLEDVIALLRSNKLRVRIGLWLMPMQTLGREKEMAVRLGVDASDARQPILDSLVKGQRYLGLDDSVVLSAIDHIANTNMMTDCSLVYNLDLLLARLTVAERDTFWNQLLQGLPHRPRSLLIGMPVDAQELAPQTNYLESWRRDQRLAISE